MKINYTITIYGESASDMREVEPDDVADTTWEYQDICCDDMKKLIDGHVIKPTTERVTRKSGLDSMLIFASDFPIIMRYCPFCGTKFTFHEIGRLKRVRTAALPRTRYEYEYEEKPV
jgi:hypothetical protein